MITTGVILRIALRNLKEHKAKSLIIGMIIALGIMVLFIANTMMDTASEGIRKSFIDTYTGNIMISARAQEKITLFGKQSNKLDPSVPVIPEYKKVYEHITSNTEVAAVSSQLTAFTMINFEEKAPGTESDEDLLSIVLFGVEPHNYRNTFRGNIEMLDGKFLKSDEQGILLQQSQIEKIKDSMDISLSVGDTIVLSGFSSFGFKIREIPIKGIFRFISGATLKDSVGLIDVQSLRSLAGITIATDAEIELDSEETNLLTASGFDELFSGNMVETGDTTPESTSEESLLSILGDTSERTSALTVDSGAWHFILIKLKDSTRAKPVIEDLNNYFRDEGIQAQAVDWMAAAGMMGSFADGIRIFINVLIIIVAVVAVIIIMNTLVISVIERTSEIGTMRALGAQRSFVRGMFMLETLSISVISGCLGIIAGAAIIAVLNFTGLKAPNMVFEVMFGGEVLHPVLSFPIIIQSMAVVLIIGIVASLYPVAVALRIQPVRAIQSE